MNWKQQLDELRKNTDAWYFQDLAMYVTGYNAAVSEYKEKQSVSRLADVTKAENLLKGKISEIWSELHPAERSFDSQADVVEYLSDEGYKVGKSKFSADKNSGLIKCEDDGTFSLKAVLKYAETLDRLDGGQSEGTSFSERKADFELQEREIKLRQLQREEDVAAGKYILREEYESDLASRAMLFRNDLENFAMREAPEIVALVSGDERMTPDLVEHLLDGFGRILNSYAERKVVTVDVSS